MTESVIGARSTTRLEPATLTCADCGEPSEASYTFCPHCGTVLQSRVVSAETKTPVLPQPGDDRRRLGGTRWTRPLADEGTSDVSAIAADTRDDRTRPAKRRRRRRHRRRFRRPLFIVPCALMLVGLLAVGVLAYRAESTIDRLGAVSTPPPVAMDNTVGDEPVPAGVVIDSGPAQQAVREAEAAERVAAGEDPAAAEDDRDLFGRIKEAASDTGDLAEGAAIAAGVKEPSQDTLTILVMGVDARPGAPIDVSVRPDALMVLRLDPASGSCRALAIPRDTKTELPGYGQSKVNHALMVGGIPYQMLVVERLLGIELDRYALIDFTGFEALVDAAGGVPVTVPQEIAVDGQVVFVAGPQTFDGAQALAYARYRGGADVDVGRVRRQQQIIRGLIAVGRGRNVVRDVNELLPALEQHLRTDLAPSELVAISDHYRTSCTENALELDSLQGDFLPSETPDPLFKQTLTYNVVDEATIREKVVALTRP